MKELTSLSRYQLGTLQYTTENADLYSGTDTVLNRSVCLRIFKEARVRDVRLRNQLSQSLQRATELVHPHIAWIWETGEEDGILFSVERSLSGQFLSDRLANDRRLSWEDAFRYFRHLSQAIQFAHGRKMIHGDINSTNVMLSDEHGAVLMGFGLTQVFAGSIVLSENDDQAGLARLLLVMLTGRTDPVTFTTNTFEWPFAVPMLVREPILRGLGNHPQGFYYNVEEFFEAVEEQASLPQPDLPAAEITRMQVEEDAYEKTFEAARQAREDAKRQEALAAARKEIGDEIQKALDEHLSIEQELTDPAQPGSAEQSESMVHENAAPQALVEATTETAPSEPVKVVEEPSLIAVENPEQITFKPVESAQPQKPQKKRRKILVYLLIILILVAILAVLAWVWYQGGFTPLFPI
jgi:serine/threonine protein kinase